MGCLSLTAATVLLLTLGACGDDANKQVAQANASGPVVAHYSGGGDGNAALIEGPLTMSEGCLMVGEYPVVWPHGTTWDPDQRAVLLSDGRVIALGDRVSGGGGYPHLAELETKYADPLAKCPTNKYGEVAMFNAGEEIEVE